MIRQGSLFVIVGFKNGILNFYFLLLVNLGHEVSRSLSPSFKVEHQHSDRVYIVQRRLAPTTTTSSYEHTISSNKLSFILPLFSISS